MKLTVEQTTVAVWHWAMYRSEKNFARPDEFIPERWIDSQEFEGDAKSALQPFQVGPRNCLGRKYARPSKDGTIVRSC